MANNNNPDKPEISVEAGVRVGLVRFYGLVFICRPLWMNEIYFSNERSIKLQCYDYCL